MKAVFRLVAALALSGALSAAGQVCTEDFCEIPTDGMAAVREPSVKAVSHGYVDAGKFAAFLAENALGGKDGAPPAGDGRSDGGAAGPSRAMAIQILLAFLSGLLLNLSPCVLPIIPIQVAILGMGAEAPSRRAGALRGLVHGTGIALTYGILGLAAVRFGAVFGRIQSTAAFNAALALVFAALALAALGVFNIDFSRYGSRARTSASLAGIFAAGVASALLAGACVAPAAIAVIIHAADQYAAGSAAALALPFALGCGMALPWPFVGAGVAVLPRPGKWMRYVKYAFALVVALLAVSYAGKAYRAATGTRLDSGSDVVDYTAFDAAFADAKAAGKPVVIDFFATWCGSCEAMEKNVFTSPKVAEALAKCTFLRVRVDELADDNAIALLARFGVRGFPAIVVVAPDRE